jgi:hypothetical protein
MVIALLPFPGKIARSLLIAVGMSLCWIMAAPWGEITQLFCVKSPFPCQIATTHPNKFITKTNPNPIHQLLTY